MCSELRQQQQNTIFPCKFDYLTWPANISRARTLLASHKQFGICLVPPSFWRVRPSGHHETCKGFMMLKTIGAD